MNRHIESVHQKLKKYHCDLCDKKYAEKKGLMCHIASFHERKKPHKCSTCGRRFIVKKTFEQHICKYAMDFKNSISQCPQKGFIPQNM